MVAVPGPPPPPRPNPDEEELRTEPGGLRPALLVLATCALAALVTVAVLAVHGRNAPHAPAAATSTRPAVSTTDTSPATSGTVPTARCPTGASCSTAHDLPVSTTSALRAVLPDAIVTSSASLVANRPGHFEPDLVARDIEALAGGNGALSLRIAAAPPGTLPAGTRVVQAAGTATGARAVGRVDGFVLSAVFSGHSPAARSVRAAAVRALRRLVTAAALTDAQ